jgi:hypothetical protein
MGKVSKNTEFIPIKLEIVQSKAKIAINQERVGEEHEKE